jgi:lipopolysaccharide/colanic/teichoic acid biosynthesis glycosyltransferase
MPNRQTRPRRPGERAVELAIAISTLVFLAPLLVMIAFLVKLTDGGPSLFGQERLGLGGRTFRCLKFRTMAVDADARLSALLATDAAAAEEWSRSYKLKNDPRVTPIGNFLRRSSLDELPQLLNVIRGEMSLVGPRPIVASEVERYGIHFRHYCAVRPGLTGLWQVSGRNDRSYRERVVMDVAYVRSRCIRLDLKILAATLPAVVTRRGSY